MLKKMAKKIGHIQREFNMLSDALSFEVFDEDEVLFLTAIVIVINNFADRVRDSK